LHQHPDPPKNWDHLAALASLLDHTEQSDGILDAGGAKYSPLAEWLYIYGYRDLHVLNLGFEGVSKRGPIQYREGDITNSSYDAGRFDAITSLSVIEHDVDVNSFLQECSRLLKSGGYLVLSTDFWKEPLDNESVEAYGMPWKPFTPDRINSLIDTAESVGFTLTSEYDLTTDERTVEWKGESFTFIQLEFKYDMSG
jgi:SAM-dependent methyltransferase